MNAEEYEKFDKYYTPPWPVRLLLDVWGAVEPGDVVAEPCCGRGDICDVVETYGCETIAGDIKPDPSARIPKAQDRISRDVIEVDATLPKAGRFYDDADVVITNPPYFAETATAGQVLESIVDWKKTDGRAVASDVPGGVRRSRVGLDDRRPPSRREGVGAATGRVRLPAQRQKEQQHDVDVGHLAPVEIRDRTESTHAVPLRQGTPREVQRPTGHVR